MNKKILALVLACITLFLLGCEPDISGKEDENNGGDGNLSLEAGEVVFRGKITEIQKSEIHMEIVESDIAFGLYRVLVQSSTPFYDKDGKEITKDDLKAGDKIDVVFAGQVMQSYPPQIAAIRVYLAK